MKCKYVITNDTNPYRNLATEQVLMGYVSKGEFILFLWQNDNTVVIGRNQDAYAECRVDELYSSGGRLSRRRSGGGAVYHDLGNLNYSILSHQTDRDLVSYQWLVATALKQLGIETDFNGRNDLTCQGRKFSGNAMYEEKDSFCSHGTILIASDIQRMSLLLTPEQAKLDRNHVSSVRSRVMNLREVNPEITLEKVKDALLSVCDSEPLCYDEKDKEIEKLTGFYKGKEWLFGGIR